MHLMIEFNNNLIPRAEDKTNLTDIKTLAVVLSTMRGKILFIL